MDDEGRPLDFRSLISILSVLILLLLLFLLIAVFADNIILSVIFYGAVVSNLIIIALVIFDYVTWGKDE